jgi:uncharacterized protein (DUF169 family)
MANGEHKNMSDFIRNDLRLKTFPLTVKFLKKPDEFPEKTRRPSVSLKKRITICQAVTMARTYGWTVGLTKEDLICVPAMIAFGFSGSADPGQEIGNLFCDIDLAKDLDGVKKELSSMSIMKKPAFQAILLSPLAKGLVEPDTVVFYGNPAQVMRLVQAVVYSEGSRIAGNFGGKVECTEYLLAAFLTDAPRVAMPGNGDRIFSMTQDDEMTLSIPGRLLPSACEGLKNVGRAIGARYPVTFYQNFQPQFPPQHMNLGKDLGLF